MAVYALDTTAVSAVLHREPGSQLVQDLLGQAASGEDTVLLPFVVLMETEYTSLRGEAIDVVEQWLEWVSNWPVKVIESSYEWRRVAAMVKSQFRLSFADAWVASLALLNEATLVHKDPEFDAIEELEVLRLPYDRDSGALA